MLKFDPDKTYTMKATDVSSLIFRFWYHEISLESERVADLWEGGGTPLVFPVEGIYVEKFDTLFQTEASIKADTAYLL